MEEGGSDETQNHGDPGRADTCFYTGGPAKLAVNGQREVGLTAQGV